MDTTGRIVTGKRMLSAAIVLLMIIAFFAINTMQARAEETESSAEFVKSAVKAINSRKDTPDLFYAGDAYEFDISQTPLSSTYFAFLDFKAEDVEGYPSLVEYSCRIPGVITASYCTAYDTCFFRLPKYSEWVEVSGMLRVLNLDDGTRKIDISDCDNAFAAFATFKYINPYYFGYRNVDVSQGYNSSNRQGVVNTLASLGADAYAKMLGYLTTQEYIDAVVLPDLENAQANADKWQTARNQAGFRQTKILIMICIGIMSLPVLYGLYMLLTVRLRKTRLALARGSTKSGREDSIRMLDYDKYRSQLSDIAMNDSSSSARSAALDRMKYPEDRDTIRAVAKSDSMRHIREKAIEMLSYPEDKDLFIDLIEKSETGQFAAFKKLQYPEDRDVFIMAARMNTNPNFRFSAVEKLEMADTVKAEAEVLDYVIREDSSIHCRLKALEQLSYPQHRSTIRYAAQYEKDIEPAALAVSMLSPADDKKLIRMLTSDNRTDVRRAAIRKLKYKDGKDILRITAEKDADRDVRLEALGKLSPDTDHNVIERMFRNDTDAICRQSALSMLSYDKAHDELLNIALKDDDPANRRIALEKLRFPQDKDAIITAASRDKDPDIREIASDMLPFTEKRDAVVKAGLYTAYYDELSDRMIGKAEKAAIMLALEPENTKSIKQFLCRNIQRGFIEGDHGKYTTLAGWSAAALGRVLALSFDPADLEKNYDMIKPAFEKYNEYVTSAQELYKEFKECRDDFKSYREKNRELQHIFSREIRLEELSGMINNVHSKMAPGPGGFMVENGDEPMAYLVYILRNNESKVPRFLKQGVIMGLLDWLSSNRSDPQAGELLKTVIEVRKEMITTDDKLSFFEVRVPDGCISDDYAKILADVLHCANPSVRYADMSVLMDIAEKEVPGCMDMLTACPLRIIDPVNQTDLGFYQFEPYIHRLWYLYQLPYGTGQVNARYHEVDDMTRPLSSGLNLRLFTDPYSVIPTLFHEHEHYAGDVNEASVFLKTQMFSIRFYKKYKGAKPARDIVFATLTDLLGMPPAADKRDALNDLIRKYYGEQTTKKEAEERADEQIDNLNKSIRKHNKNQKWCPEIRYPLFTVKEDNKNRVVIHDSIVKFCTAPKHVTEQEFRDIIEEA